jgi:RimJ/RimL family protein N-acetyltransferase
MNVTIPVLETKRLILREWRNEDFEEFAAMSADAEVMKYLGGVQERNDAWRTMARMVGHWQLRGYGMWVVTRKPDGAFLGRIGLVNPEGWPSLEVGWGLARGAQGQGYATEAAAAAMRFAFETQPIDKVISSIDPDNVASQAVAKRLGETKGERIQMRIEREEFPVDLWSITRDEWQRREAAGI